jgi:hypothetical protein
MCIKFIPKDCHISTFFMPKHNASWLCDKNGTLQIVTVPAPIKL